MAQNQKNIGLIVALVLLFGAILGGVGWFLSQDDDSEIPTKQVSKDDPEPAKEAPPAEIAKPNADPEPAEEPKTAEPLPEPPTTISVEPATLPILSKYRKRVLDADLLVEITANKTLTDKQKLEIASKLLALESRFAPLVISMIEGSATAADLSGFQDHFRASFKSPEIDRTSWDNTDAERVSIWCRPSATLPDEETDDQTGVPLKRRRQETVDQKTVTSWLEAIEAEFGKTDISAKDGKKPLDILIFEDPSQFHQFALKRLRIEIPKWSAGFYSSGWEVVAVPVNPKVSMAEVVRHEVFHAVQSRLARHSLLIPWFSEGTAEWLDKAPPSNGVLQTNNNFASMAYGYLGNLVKNGLELRLLKFMQLTLEDFYANPKLNYLMAYCLVDFLRGEEDYRPTYFEFWELLKQGVDAESAFSRSFGRLDFASLTRRFKVRIAQEPIRRTAPQFLNDAKVDYLERMPATLPTLPTAAANEGEIAAGWFDALGKLEEKGFDTGRGTYLAEQYDELVVAIDSSETMSNRLDKNTFDFDSLSRWLFSMRYAPSLKLTRKSADGKKDEAVPPAIIMSLVDAVILDKIDDFTAATGIKIGKSIQKDINKGWNGFGLSASFLSGQSKRDIGRYTAESIAWYWGVRQDKAKVTVIDFNMNAQVVSDSVKFKEGKPKKISSPLAELFKKTKANQAAKYTDGADCNWWAALQNVLKIGNENGSKKFAFIMLTDGPNSFGTYGHTEGGKDPEVYLRDQKNMAKRFAEEWLNANLNASNRPSVLQIVAMPGAEGEGLDELPKACPQARLDEWVPRFDK
ncbi:MAG: hypothetical protein L3J82_06285 [Planctomycetes bacterium]|nr:hypothetical protein [Planctomycetota bacterium]